MKEIYIGERFALDYVWVNNIVNCGSNVLE